MSQDPRSRDADPDIARADKRYVARDWAGALSLYEAARWTDPERAAARSVPLLIGHCRIELAADPAQPLPEAPVVAVGSPREQWAVAFAWARALEMCRAADTVRASQLLRFLSGYDPAMADTYRDILGPGRSAASLTPPVDRDPPFIAALGLADLPIDALKQAHRGRRLLLVYRQFFPDGGPRQAETSHCYAVSAERFGLAVTRFRPQATDPAGVAPELLQTLIAEKPDIVLYDGQYPSSITADPEPIRMQLESVLEMARQHLGVRVVASYMDAWQPMQIGPDALFRGLGTAFDVIQHCHPAALGVGTPAQNAGAYCYMAPAWVPAPSVAYGTVPRACFAGSITSFNVSRLAWWAEIARRGLPIDFFETRHLEGAPRSDQDYVDLFARHQLALGFARRAGGPKIITGRTLDIPLLGGVLLEESSSNTAFFLQPGVHYVPFETLDDLAALIPALLADGERRARIRAAGQRWVQTYFTGDYFWAGLLRKLAG